MKTFDDLVVMFATSIMRGVLAVGTGFAYMQMLALAVLVAMVGTVGFAVVVTILKGLVFGK
jgi:hypothetical protein